MLQRLAHLDGHAELALDGTRRLREDSKMGRAAASADSAASPMEEHQGDIKLVCHLHQVFLQPQHTGLDWSLAFLTLIAACPPLN